jgi:hypothetical protein
MHQVMANASKHRQLSKGETLSPISGLARRTVESPLIPGFRKEPRPLLSFILRVLDGKHAQMVRQHLEAFLRFDFQISTPERDVIQRRLADDPALISNAVDGMIAGMREMADMWIDSGKSLLNPEADTPADRNVEDVQPGREYSLALLIYRALLRTEPAYKELCRDGSQKIIEHFPRFDPQQFLELDEMLKAHGRKWAAFYFSRLLDSRDSLSLSRCDHCKSYFAYERARLRKVKHGVFCPKCKGTGSVKRTEASRKARLDTATRAWIEYGGKPHRLNQREWVAGEVNKSHGTSFGARWVSQHLKEIQERVEAQRNAKG